MKRGQVGLWTSWLALLALLTFPPGLNAQQDKIATLKQALAANQQLQRQYKWVETTVVSMKGEEKSRIQKQCFYSPDGKVQKQQLSAPPEQSSPGGVKGKVVAKKKEEITATMNQAAALVQSYVPPDPQRIQATKAAGNLALSPTGPDSTRVDLRNFVKSGDTLSLSLDTARNVIQTISVKSYLEAQADAVTLDVTFAQLRGGLSYPGSIVLNVPKEQIQVVIQNSNYERVTPAGQATPQKAQAAPAGVSTTAIDNLTAPIALYPDALVAQILQASTDVPGVLKFAGWLKSNASLKGSALQDAAQAAGFAAWFVALAPFPQVVQMLAEKPDWTQQLGKAFTTSRSAVFESIQRLRAAAQALGNLKTTPQQEVVTETTSSGTQVIVIQPANPEVIYVPVYNTTTVYVQPAPPPSSASVAGAAVIGFTAGIIIGSSHNHYYGRWGAYDEAWDRREDYAEDRQDYAEDRRENAQGNQSQRQSAAQGNQSQRQSAAQSNQSSRQSTAQSSQENRQSTAQTSQSTRQTSGASTETAQANQANRQSTAQTNQSSRQGTAQSSQANRQSAGYQSGASARAQSSRGSASRGSRSGGGSRRR